MCSSGSLKVILVEPDNNYICVKIPGMSKSCSDDSSLDIITVPSDNISPEDIRGMYVIDFVIWKLCRQLNYNQNQILGSA